MLDGGVLGGEPLSTTDLTRDINMEKWITHRSWRKSVARREGPHGEVSADRGRTWGARAFIRVCGVPGLVPDWPAETRRHYVRGT